MERCSKLCAVGRFRGEGSSARRGGCPSRCMLLLMPVHVPCARSSNIHVLLAPAQVAEGWEVLDKINEAFTDADGRPYQNIRYGTSPLRTAAVRLTDRSAHGLRVHLTWLRHKNAMSNTATPSSTLLCRCAVTHLLCPPGSGTPSCWTTPSPTPPSWRSSFRQRARRRSLGRWVRWRPGRVVANQQGIHRAPQGSTTRLQAASGWERGAGGNSERRTSVTNGTGNWWLGSVSPWSSDAPALHWHDFPWAIPSTLG